MHSALARGTDMNKVWLAHAIMGAIARSRWLTRTRTGRTSQGSGADPLRPPAPVCAHLRPPRGLQGAGHHMVAAVPSAAQPAQRSPGRRTCNDPQHPPTPALGPQAPAPSVCALPCPSRPAVGARAPRPYALGADSGLRSVCLSLWSRAWFQPWPWGMERGGRAKLARERT